MQMQLPIFPQSTTLVNSTIGFFEKEDFVYYQNMIKMICYRVETSCANLLSSGFKKSLNEKRALVKSIIFSHADILPDYANNTLTVSIYSQANPRMNHALETTLELLNQTETTYPGTNLVLNYKIAT